MKLTKPSGAGAVSFNFTPMIDVIFNLLIFFVLTAQFMTLEVEDVMLPASLTAEPKDYTQFRNVVINVVNPDKPAMVVMGREFSLRELTEHLKMLNQSAQAEHQKMNVILRADRRICYEEVARAMLATGAAEIEGWWIQTDISKTERDVLKSGSQ